MPGPRVMFIHGLEGHPEGSKVVKLRAQGFEVHAADMHMSLWQLGKRNSIARNILHLRLPSRRQSVKRQAQRILGPATDARLPIADAPLADLAVEQQPIGAG